MKKVDTNGLLKVRDVGVSNGKITEWALYEGISIGDSNAGDEGRLSAKEERRRL
jgi:hypothetical protein